MNLIKTNIWGQFDVSDYLDSEELIAEYLTVALADSDQDAFFGSGERCSKSQGLIYSCSSCRAWS